MDKPVKSVTHGQCDVRPTVTFPVAGHCCPATGTKFCCLVTEAHVCEQLGQGRYLTVEQLRIKLATSRVVSQHLNVLRNSTFCLLACLETSHFIIVFPLSQS